MKRKWMAVLTAGVLCVPVGCAGGGASVRAPAATEAGKEPALTTQTAQEPLVLKTQREKQSYAIGVETARNFKRQGFEVDVDIVVRGMKDAAAGGQLLLTEEELLATMNLFGSQMIAVRGRERAIAGLDNRAEGEAFLAENKTKEGVVALPSGLQYKIIKAGDGQKPIATDTVECHYRGTLINGTEFENTASGGEPATIRLSDSRVIPGFREALKLMPVGSKWQLFIPSQLAYGQRGVGGVIGPYATLIFEVELLAIK